jgi:hypothetical protein
MEMNMRRCVLAAMMGMIGAVAAPALAQQPPAEAPPRPPLVVEPAPPAPVVLTRSPSPLFDAVSGLAATEPTLEGLRAGRGNLARWRDAERARIGPALKENIEANKRAEAQYQAARETLSVKQRRKLPRPKRLPEGRLLPPVVGYAAHFYVKDGVERVGLGALIWDDVGSDAGTPSVATVALRRAGDFCGRFSAPLEDLVYLGPEWTPPMAALEEALLPEPSPEQRLSIYDVAWFKPPNGAILSRTFPPRALAREKPGTATLTCTITEGPLACTLVSESPAGWGFGEAALTAASMIEVAPQLPDGSSAIGRELCAPFTYVFAE